MAESEPPGLAQEGRRTLSAARGGIGPAPPDRGPRSAVRDELVCVLLRAVMLFFRVLPGWLGRGIGRGLGLFVWALSGANRRRVLQHMEIAFRDSATPAQKRLWCRKHFEHLGLFVVEFSRLPRLTRENLGALAEHSQLAVLHELLARRNGKGVLCVPAHHGNWELAGYAASLLGFPLKSVARPLDNPLLNARVDAMRTRSGNEIIHKYQVLWKLKKLLDGGGLVTMSVDQNGGVAGVFVPLFGTPASTVASPAELHLATGVPIVVLTLNRQPDGVRHVFHVWDVIEHAQTGDRDADRRAILTRIHVAYEKAIRTYPEQWLWVHRRWKTRPPGETPGPDGLPPQLPIQNPQSKI